MFCKIIANCVEEYGKKLLKKFIYKKRGYIRRLSDFVFKDFSYYSHTRQYQAFNIYKCIYINFKYVLYTTNFTKNLKQI